MPSLSIVLAATTSAEPGAVAFVYPRSTDVATSAAVVAALSKAGADYGMALDSFRNRGLARGQRVAVQPTGYVYEYDGPFDDGRHAFDTPGVRLRILESTRRARRSAVREPTVRRFPADQIARLKPTDRVAPRGEQNTDLGEWEESALDRLIGIRTGGNTGLLRNRVMLFSTRSEVDRFAEIVTLRRGEQSSAVGGAVTFGIIQEDGELRCDDRYQSEDEPLVATTHLVERLAGACERAEPFSKIVLADGAAGLARNFQAFDRIVSCQRLVIIGDANDAEYLTELQARGCRIWSMSSDEVMLGSAGFEGAGVFADVKRASIVATNTRIEAVPVDDASVDRAAEELARASGALRQETDENITRPVGQAFGALLELVGWFGPPAPADVGAYLTRIGSILAEVERVARWAPSDATQALRSALQHMTRAASEPLVGWSRLEALVFSLDALRASGRRVAVATRSAPAAAALRDHLPDYLRSVPVFGAGLIPSDLALDTVIVASWLKTDGMTRLLNLYLAPEVQVISAPFERKWLSGLAKRRRGMSRHARLDRSAKLSILGLTSDAIIDGSEELVTAPAESAEALPDSLTVAGELGRMEGWGRRTTKGHPAEAVADHDLREARYVGFVGDTYAYVTLGRSLPVVTDLVRGVSAQQAKVPLMTIDRLRPGEFVLFRDQGDRDVISLFAEHELGSAAYKSRRVVAEQWRAVLSGLGSSHFAISHRLREAGVAKHPATIRSWVLDPDKIGPGSRADVEAIARAAGASPEWVSEVWNAIADIRGAHIAAGRKLSQFLLSELPKKLRTVGEAETQVDLTLVQVWVVAIEEIGEVETRSYTEVNRLLWA